MAARRLIKSRSRMTYSNRTAIVGLGFAGLIVLALWIWRLLTPSIPHVPNRLPSGSSPHQAARRLTYTLKENHGRFIEDGAFVLVNQDSFQWTNVTVDAQQHDVFYRCETPRTVDAGAALRIALSTCSGPNGETLVSRVHGLRIEATEGGIGTSFEPDLSIR